MEKFKIVNSKRTLKSINLFCRGTRLMENEQILPRTPQYSVIQTKGHVLQVPDFPIIPYVEGDGVGAEIWAAAQRVFTAAVSKAYANRRSIQWLEVLAGEKAFHQSQNYLPQETLDAFKYYKVGIKGPLSTPVGGGIRSLNVTLRKELDLFVCQRPVRWFPGVPSPMRYPEKVDMVVFRENTEDVYSGIEFEAGSEENSKFNALLHENFPSAWKKVRFPETTAFGIKPISSQGSTRLVRAAVQWALDHHRRSVTLVHKGNIMKFTEGGFRKWGYELAEKEFGERVYTQMQWARTAEKSGKDQADAEKKEALAAGKLLVKDIIADAAFETAITRPEELDVLAAPNLNGDYLSDALAALVGGIGIAPGANINYQTGAAIFEATHGTAPTLAGKNLANPSSLILSGEMMFRYLGWNEAADLILKGITETIQARTVTDDFYRAMENAQKLTTAEFADAVISHIGAA
jgi:isocitrate dehydrogenase